MTPEPAKIMIPTRRAAIAGGLFLGAIAAAGSSRAQTIAFSDEYIRENRGTQKFLVPETFELANIILALTPYGIAEKRRIFQDSDYYRRVKAHFWPFREHPIVAKLNVRDDKDFGTFSMFRDNSPYWRFDGDRIVQGGPYRHRWDEVENPFRANLALVEDFARRSGFRAFFAANRAYYDALIADFSRQAPLTAMIGWLEANFGSGLRYDSYKVIFSPLVSRSHSSMRGESPAFKESLMIVGAPHIFGKNELAKIEVARMIFTEIDHNFVNPTSDRFKAEIDRAMSNIAWWNASGDYDTPYFTFNEYMTWSVFSLYAKDQYPNDDYQHFLKLNRYDMISRGFLRFTEFDKEVVRLYGERAGQTVVDIYPQTIAFSRQLQEKAVAAGAACKCA